MVQGVGEREREREREAQMEKRRSKVRTGRQMLRGPRCRAGDRHRGAARGVDTPIGVRDPEDPGDTEGERAGPGSVRKLRRKKPWA